MSKAPENEFDLDLHFLPEWARQVPDVNRYADFAGDKGNKGDRRPGDRRSGGGMHSDRGGPPRPQRSGGRQGGGQRGSRPPRGPHKPEATLPEIRMTVLPEPKGVASLARQIKLNGRAYPMFDVAGLILKKANRYLLQLDVIKKKDGTIAQTLFACNLDDTVFLSEQQAVQYVLEHHFDTFYATEKIQADPPKGRYTFVAQCGMSGTILGPPNYHDYQTKLRQLHAERFSHMPFEKFKSKVKIVKDEEVVKQWVEEQSWKYEYVVLNDPDPQKLQSREEVEEHFKKVHLANIIRQVETFTLTSESPLARLPGGLRNLCRHAVEEQKRFPLRLVTLLSQQFAGHGLQFFKVKKTLTHVSVARPRFLDYEATPVSDDVRRIVEFVQAHSDCTRRLLLESLAPVTNPEPPAEDSKVVPTAEQAVVIRNLHWLIHQGHVVEYANGRMEVAKKPVFTPSPKSERSKRQTDAKAAANLTQKTSATDSGKVETPPKAEATPAESESRDDVETPKPPQPVTGGQPAGDSTGVGQDGSAEAPAEVPSNEFEGPGDSSADPVDASESDPDQPGKVPAVKSTNGQGAEASSDTKSESVPVPAVATTSQTQSGTESLQH